MLHLWATMPLISFGPAAKPASAPVGKLLLAGLVGVAAVLAKGRRKAPPAHFRPKHYDAWDGPVTKQIKVPESMRKVIQEQLR